MAEYCRRVTSSKKRRVGSQDLGYDSRTIDAEMTESETVAFHAPDIRLRVTVTATIGKMVDKSVCERERVTMEAIWK
jgi:hypothetical protein